MKGSALQPISGHRGRGFMGAMKSSGTWRFMVLSNEL